MTPLFKKLNLGSHREILLLDAPDTFDAEIAALQDVTVARTPTLEHTWPFVLAFALTKENVERLSRIAVASTTGDAILWIAYPKQTSKKYRCEFNRDTGWQLLREEGFESVRQVAIDEDWSALRFRRKEFIRASC